MSKPTLEQLKEAAAECQTRTEFKERYSSFYKYAWRNGYLDEICAHMGDARRKWTKPILTKEAKKYSTRTEFATQHPRAYHAARAQGILDEVCAHMKPDLDTIYLLRIRDTNIFKVGVTSQTLGLDRIETFRKQIKQPLDLVLFVPLEKGCQKLETRLLHYGHRVDVAGTTNSEFRSYTEKDLWRVMNLLMTATTERQLQSLPEPTT